jgi:hypothetical protein
MRGQLLALFGCFRCPDLVEVGEENSGYAGLSEDEGRFPTDSAGSLCANS